MIIFTEVNNNNNNKLHNVTAYYSILMLVK